MKKRKLWLIPVALLLVMALAIGIYVGDYYHAEPAAAAFAAEADSGSDAIVFHPEGTPIAGLIFYPGGKVECSAYSLLMGQLADRGILCVLVPMPANLAVLNQNAADGIPEQFPEVEHWYLAGHSLGGAMAASYAAKHTDQFDGLALLAAYSTADLSESGMKVLRIYGDQDGVMKRNSYEKYAPHIPAESAEIIIPGGCHAYFGSYGAQAGDGIPAITAEQQQTITADAIESLIQS